MDSFMKFMIFYMEVLELEDEKYLIKIKDEIDETFIKFNPINKELIFLNNDRLVDFLRINEHQFRKILHNKRPNTYYIGFKTKFILREKKDVQSFNDKSKIIVLDKRYNKNISYVIEEEKAEKKIYKVYTDACYFEKKKYGGYAFIIKDLNDNYNLYTEKVTGIGSSQAELEAAIKAIGILKDIEKIRILTDSQYVRKGLTEWLPIWKLNGFKTINGDPVKNIDKWIKFDNMCKDKYIEFQWVKGHSNHFENSLCDIYAKDKAEQLNKY